MPVVIFSDDCSVQTGIAGFVDIANQAKFIRETINLLGKDKVCIRPGKPICFLSMFQVSKNNPCT